MPIFKKIITTVSALILVVSISNAQIDIKGNPFGLIFTQMDASLEYVVAEKWSIELSNMFIFGHVPFSGLVDGREFRLQKRGYRVRIAGKYYFRPQLRGSGSYIGAYVGPRSLNIYGNEGVYDIDPGYKFTALSVGLIGGYKHVFNNGFILELQAGLGYAFGKDLVLNDPRSGPNIAEIRIEGIRLITFGYRFNIRDTEKKKKRKKRRR